MLYITRVAAIPRVFYGSQGSSGCLCIDAVDMAKWMTFQLNGGVAPDGTELLTPLEFAVSFNLIDYSANQSLFYRNVQPIILA